MISSISSSMPYQASPLLANLKANGLTANKAIIAAADVKGAIEQIGMVQRGPANKAAITAALQERISSDVAAGALTAEDAAAVFKTFEQMDPAKQKGGEGPGSDVTKEQIDAAIAQIGGADSQRTAMLSKLSDNFTTVDANEDGKLSRDEVGAYLQQTGEASGRPPRPEGGHPKGAGGPPPGGGGGARGGGGQSSDDKTVLSENSVVIGNLKTTTTIYTDGTSETKTKAVSADFTSKAYDKASVKSDAGSDKNGGAKVQSYLSSIEPGSLFDFLVH